MVEGRPGIPRLGLPRGGSRRVRRLCPCATVPGSDAYGVADDADDHGEEPFAGETDTEITFLSPDPATRSSTRVVVSIVGHPGGRRADVAGAPDCGAPKACVRTIYGSWGCPPLGRPSGGSVITVITGATAPGSRGQQPKRRVARGVMASRALSCGERLVCSTCLWQGMGHRGHDPPGRDHRIRRASRGCFRDLRRASVAMPRTAVVPVWVRGGRVMRLWRSSAMVSRGGRERDG